MQQCPAFIEWPDYQHSYGFVRLHGALMGVNCTDIDKTIRGMATGYIVAAGQSRNSDLHNAAGRNPVADIPHVD